MRIIIYVMSFFIISAEKTYDEKELFKSEKYSRHEKYPNLQNRCSTVKNLIGEVGYIELIYREDNVSCIPKVFGENYLNKIRKQKLTSYDNQVAGFYEFIKILCKYYYDDVILLKVNQDYNSEKENKILPTLLDLLDAIPDKIIIKEGIINTEADSIVSGIDITETISTPPTTNSNDATSPQTTSKYGNVEYVVMEGSYFYVYYKRENKLKKMKFQLSDEESEEKIIKKIDIPCTLRVSSQNTMNDYVENVIPVSNMDEKKLKKNGIQFELRFSYICKFVSPLQIFVNKNILQYKILNFTISGYHSNALMQKPKCIGLTYCLKHQNTDKYVSNLEAYFLYQFGEAEITNEGSQSSFL